MYDPHHQSPSRRRPAPAASAASLQLLEDEYYQPNNAPYRGSSYPYYEDERYQTIEQQQWGSTGEHDQQQQQSRSDYEDAVSSSSRRDDKSTAAHSRGEPWGEVPTIAARADEGGIKRPRPSTWQWMAATWMHGWVAEWSACVLAAASLAATVVVLVYHDGEPLPQWPMGITINALVAVFGVLLKAGVVLPLSEGISQLKWQWFSQQPRRLIDLEEFDSASRGPWGSFLFLFRFDTEMWKGASPSGREWWLWPWYLVRPLVVWRKAQLLNTFAKMSAFLTILAFVIDPFTQQVVQSVPCSQKSATKTSGVPRTNKYIADTGPGTSSHLMWTTDEGMTTAITLGLVSPPSDQGASSLVSVNCSTGNCTIPDFSTLAVCHTCEDITHKIYNKTEKGIYPTYEPYPNYTLPGYNKAGDGPLALQSGEIIRTSVVYTDSSRNSIGNLTVLALPDADFESPQPGFWTYGDPAAFSCHLRPCVRTYRASVREAVLRETELSRTEIGISSMYPAETDPDDRPATYREVGIMLATTPQKSSSGVVVPPPAQGDPAVSSSSSCAGSESPQPGYVEIPSANIDAAPHVAPDPDNSRNTNNRWVPPECVWSFPDTVYRSLHNQLSLQLHGLAMYDAYSHQTTTPPDWVVRRIWGSNSNSGSSGNGSGASGGGVKGKGPTLASMDAFMRDLSDVMTAEIRNHGEGGTTTTASSTESNSPSAGARFATGDVNEMVNCVEVRWAWMSYPAALTVLSVVWLAVAAVVVSSSSASPKTDVARKGWKSSSLAVMLAELELSAEDKMMMMRHVAGAEDGEDGDYGDDDDKTAPPLFFDLTRYQMEQVAAAVEARLVRGGDGKAKFC